MIYDLSSPCVCDGLLMVFSSSGQRLLRSDFLLVSRSIFGHHRNMPIPINIFLLRTKKNCVPRKKSADRNQLIDAALVHFQYFFDNFI